MSLLSPLSTFQNAVVTIVRRAAGAHVDGEWIDGASSSTPSVGLVMTPAGARDLKVLPEGAKIEDTKRIKTTFAINNLDEFSYTDARGVTETYVVHNVRDWNVRGQIYFVALAIRQRIGV